MTYMPPRVVVGVNRPGTLHRTILLGKALRRECEGLASESLGQRLLSGNIHPMIGEALLGRRHSVATAEHTLKTALSALKRGDRRLASSRALTAVIQAAIASVGAAPLVVRRAEMVAFQGRRVIQHLVLS